MPQTIYMPQDPSAIGNMLGPAANQTANFLWNVLGQRIQQQRQQELLRVQSEYELEKQARAQRMEQEKLQSAEKRSLLGAEAKIAAANIGAQSRQTAAETSAEARKESARIYADARKAAAQLSIKYKSTKITPTEIQKFFSFYAPWYKKTFGEEKFKKDYPKGIMSVADEYFKAKSSNLMSILLGNMMGAGSVAPSGNDDLDELNEIEEELKRRNAE